MSYHTKKSSRISQRSRIKLNRMKYNVRKNVFSGRYIVRNALVVMIVAAVIALVVVVLSIPGRSKKKAQTDNLTDQTADTSDVIVDEEGFTLETANLALTQPSMIGGEDGLGDSEKAELEKLISKAERNGQAEVAKKDVQTLSNSQYDMTHKFLTENDAVNIRVSPDPNAQVLGRLYVGGTGDVLEKGDDWTLISSDGIEGYVATDLILMDEAATEVAPKYWATFAIVKEKVRVRAYGNEASEVYFLAVTGEFFTVDKDRSTPDWVCVRLADGSYGFVATKYISISEGFAEAVTIDEIEGMKDRKSDYKARMLAQEKDREQAALDKEQAAKDKKAKEDQDLEDAKAQAEAEKNGGNTVISLLNTTDTTVTVETTVSDLYLLAAIVYAESGGECYDAQLAVANVVVNRLKSSRYPNTMAEVIYQPYQFTACKTKNFANALKNGGSASSLRAAQEALAGINNVGPCIGFKFPRAIDYSKVTYCVQYGAIMFFTYY